MTGAGRSEPDLPAIRADYHVHTGLSSDSSTPAEAVLERALAMDLDVLSVTNDDTIEDAHRHLRRRLRRDLSRSAGARPRMPYPSPGDCEATTHGA